MRSNAISSGGAVIGANSRAQTANRAWSGIHHWRRGEGELRLRGDIERLGGRRRSSPIFAHPARHHCLGELFDPLLEQRGDFLVQICGVVETRELVALKRGVGRFVQKMPWWSDAMGSHG